MDYFPPCQGECPLDRKGFPRAETMVRLSVTEGRQVSDITNE